MNRICWRLADLVSVLLEPHEREAVRGDLTEAHCHGGRALRDILGLVCRRQAALWMDWRPWLGLLGLAVPLALLLSLAVRSWSESSAIDAFAYLNNGDWAYLSYPGWRADVIDAAGRNALDYLALSAWSWTTGVAIAVLSPRTAWVNGSVFILVVMAEFLSMAQPHHPFNAVVFAFYGHILPAVLRVAFVVTPGLWGMRMGHAPRLVTPWPAMTVALLVAALTAVETRALQQSAIVGWWHLEGFIYGAGHVHAGWQVQLLPLLALWPAVYLVARAGWPRVRPTRSVC